MDDNDFSDIKVYLCENCNKSFTKLGYLEKHKLSHTRELRFKCNYCVRSFSRAWTLQVHERRHTGERPFKCKYCGGSFTQSSTLKRHEKIHSADISYICKYCERGFKHLRSLKSHEKIHTGIRPYSCKYCEKNFSRSISLKNHERIHKRCEQYISSDCNGIFIDPSNIECRQMNPTGEKQYTSDECQMSSSTLGNICYHIKENHMVKEVHDSRQGSELSAVTNIQHFNSSNSIETLPNYSQNFTLCGDHIQPGIVWTGEIENPNIVSMDTASLVCGICFDRCNDVDDLHRHYLIHYDN